jgi:hypothetical protein
MAEEHLAVSQLSEIFFFNVRQIGQTVSPRFSLPTLSDLMKTLKTTLLWLVSFCKQNSLFY